MNHSAYNPVLRGLTTGLLTTHLAVFGASGSGKSTCLISMAIQLYRLGIPFLYIEPFGSELRSLKMLKNHADKTVRA